MRIDIGTALKKLADTYDEQTNEVKTFGIRFLKQGGEKREFSACRKNVKLPSIKYDHQKADPKSKGMYNLKYNGVIMLFDEDDQQPKNVPVSMIYQFKDFKSNTWLDVFH